MDQVQVQWSLDKADSLHPHIITAFQASNVVAPGCWFDAIYELPASVFVDPNQLPRHVHVFGETDLEAPLEHVKEPRGSTVVIRRFPTMTYGQVDLPLHLRYQRPSSSSSYRSIRIPKPRVGWTCLNEKDTVYMSNPMPPLHDTLIPPQRMDPALFTFEETQGPRQDYLELKVPVGHTQDAEIVQLGTTVAVVFSSFWIVWAIWKSLAKRRRYDAKGKRRRSE
ncbi:PIG-X [Fennellomyces sp. T-0311]|nr:PIG-X [Fennellomyces sp. T-0311]